MNFVEETVPCTASVGFNWIACVLALQNGIKVGEWQRR